MPPDSPNVSLPGIIDEARAAYLASYAPYSKVHVGALLVAKDGTTYPGCNLEVVNKTGGICAERTALATAVVAGRREFTHIAVMSDTIANCWPCGVCREVLAEFGELIVVVASEDGTVSTAKLTELLPHHRNL